MIRLLPDDYNADDALIEAVMPTEPELAAIRQAEADEDDTAWWEYIANRNVLDRLPKLTPMTNSAGIELIKDRIDQLAGAESDTVRKYEVMRAISGHDAAIQMLDDCGIRVKPTDSLKSPEFRQLLGQYISYRRERPVS